VIAKAHEVGLMNPHVPEELGGAGLGAIEGALIGEELSGAAPESRPRSSRTSSAPSRC
jgi:alkylation response protein AidB-like acyl-CoA dehydrogenase